MVREIVKLDNLMDGAITERWRDSLNKVLKNIYDPNTDAKKTRSITMTISLTPVNERRDAVLMKSTIKEKLADPMALEQTIMLERSDNCAVRAVEMTDQVPGQIDFDGGVQPEPRVEEIGEEGTVINFAR